jgi:hypothetical protein
VLDASGEVDAERTAAARRRLAETEREIGLGPGQLHPVGAGLRLAAGAD